MLEWIPQYLPETMVYIVAGYVVYYIQKTHAKIDDAMSEEEVRQLIDDKIAPNEVRMQEIKEDIKDIREKLDKLIEKL